MSPGQWRKSTSGMDNVPLLKAPARSEQKPVCPLHETGACPLSNPQPARLASQEMLSSVAGKIPDGEQVMADLKRHEALSAPPVVAGEKRVSAAARTGK
jgi:hypothetical protein